MKQELFTLSGCCFFCAVDIAQSLVFCVVFFRSLFVILFFFLLVIVFSVVRITASDYAFDVCQSLFTLSGEDRT